MNDDIPAGPAGRFPDGRIGDEARGELPSRISIEDGRVVIDFGGWVLTQTPDAARKLGLLMIRYAVRADGKPFTLEL